jgi:hypothetical protein
MFITNDEQTHRVEAGVFMPSLAKLDARGQHSLMALERKRKSLDAFPVVPYLNNIYDGFTFPQQFFDELKTLGVPTPFDKVEVSLNLGGFLYDIYISGVTIPAAPLAKKFFEKELLDLATALQEKTISLNDKFLQGIKEVMLDDEKWGKVKVHVNIKVGDSKIVVPTNASSADLFPGILSAATRMFMENQNVGTKHANSKIG